MLIFHYWITDQALQWNLSRSDPVPLRRRGRCATVLEGREFTARGFKSRANE